VVASEGRERVRSRKRYKGRKFLTPIARESQECNLIGVIERLNLWSGAGQRRTTGYACAHDISV